MRKIIARAMLAIALIAGTAAVISVHPQIAFADGGGCNGSGC